MTEHRNSLRGSTADVLDGLRAKADRDRRAEVEKAELTIEWALLNEADPAACVGFFADKALAVAGEGAPLVSEFALMEYAAALGISTDAGFAQVARVLELRYRLPRLWGRVLAGKVSLWRAGRVAEQTTSLPVAGAASVDQHLAPVAHSCSWAQIDRTVEAAMVRFDPEAAEAKRRRRRRGATSMSSSTRSPSTAPSTIDAEVDLADALDLEDALRAGAEAAGGPRVAPSLWTSAAPSPWVTWPGVSSPSGSKTPSPAERWTWWCTSPRTP